MGNKIKQWRQSRRKDEEDTIDEEELLYLQGLVRCQSCEIPYPNYFVLDDVLPLVQKRLVMFMKQLRFFMMI